jgi:hypothetical protein
MKKLLLASCLILAAALPANASDFSIEQTAIINGIGPDTYAIAFVIRSNTTPRMTVAVNCACYVGGRLVDSMTGLANVDPMGKVSGTALSTDGSKRPDVVECTVQPLFKTPSPRS